MVGNKSEFPDDTNYTYGEPCFNDTCEAYLPGLYRHNFTTGVVLCCGYALVFILGLIGNSFVIAVVYRSSRMRTVTNYFIVNLAVADILVIVFCLPATLISNIYVPWMLGRFMCKSFTYVQTVSVSASVNSLVSVSLDRFLAIWFPLRPQITKRTARTLLILIWILAGVIAVPMAVFFDLQSYEAIPNWEFCVEIWPSTKAERLYFLIAHLLLCYLLPLKLISAFYIMIWIKVAQRSIPGDGDSRDGAIRAMQQRSKIKVVKMLAVVVLIFMLSWLPLYVIFARIKLGREMGETESGIIAIVTPIAQWLGSSNSCINPILYAFFNKKFRLGFLAILRSRSCCGSLRSDAYLASTVRRQSSFYPQQCAAPQQTEGGSVHSRRGIVYSISGKTATAITNRCASVNNSNNELKHLTSSADALISKSRDVTNGTSRIKSNPKETSRRRAITSQMFGEIEVFEVDDGPQINCSSVCSVSSLNTIV